MAPRQGSCGSALRRIGTSRCRQGGRARPRLPRWWPLVRAAWAIGLVAALLGLALFAATVTAERSLRGTPGHDLLRGDSGPNLISGGRSADRLYGVAGND